MKSIFSTLLTDTKTTDNDNSAGVLRFENDKFYRWVLNTETNITPAAGDVVAHVLTDGTTAHKRIKQTVTANLGFLAGAVMATTLPPTYYGWVQCYGNGSVSVSGATTGGTNIAAGDYLKGVTGTNSLVRDAATSPSYRRTVQIQTAVTTTTTPAAALKNCFISCLG